MDTPSHPMIEARDLSKFFGPFVAIENISFSIPVGQIVAFLGPNGAGKSTTMKILAGFMAPSQGSALIGGMDVHSDRIEASRKLGYLPENGPLYLDMTPLELLHFFGEARGFVGEELDRRIDWVAGRHSIREVLDKPISKLSKGYRQRVGLAQALGVRGDRPVAGRSRRIRSLPRVAAPPARKPLRTTRRLGNVSRASARETRAHPARRRRR